MDVEDVPLGEQIPYRAKPMVRHVLKVRAKSTGRDVKDLELEARLKLGFHQPLSSLTESESWDVADYLLFNM